MLRVVSAIYLAIPFVIFACGWLRASYACLLAGAVALLVADVVRREGRLRLPDRDLLRSWRSLVTVALLVVGVMAVSGTGGFGYANFDHDKHAAMLSDLIHSQWPVRFAEAGDAPLVFYVGWYLVAALVGKVAGWAAANLALWAWTLVGFAIACAWFVRITGPLETAAWRVAVFLLLSGWDVFGWALLGSVAEPGWHLEQWSFLASVDASYQCATTVLLWVPHQGIAAWILSGWLIDRGHTRTGERDLPALLALGTLWTPWACVGLLPLAAWLAIRSRAWRAIVTQWTWIPALVVAVIIGLYYLAKAPDPSTGWTMATLAGREGTGAALGFYLLFVVLEVLPLALIAGFTVFADPGRHASLAMVTLVSLLLLPLVRAGAYNDLTMRASIPALFTLAALGLCSAGRSHAWGTRRSVAVLLLLAPGLVTPGYEWLRSWRGGGFHHATPRARRILDLDEAHHAGQYVGRPGSLYDTALAAPRADRRPVAGGPPATFQP